MNDNPTVKYLMTYGHRQGESIRALAKEMGISKTHAWLVLRGKSRPSTFVAERFLERFNITLKELNDVRRCYLAQHGENDGSPRE